MFRRLIITLFLTLFLNTTAFAEIALENIDGSSISLSSLQGKWVFINYWASWCNPCLEEINEFNRFYKQHKTDNVAIFAVNFDRLPLYKQQRLAQQFSIRYPSIQYRSARQLHLGEISVVPVTFVINPKGELVSTLYGGQTMESLNEVMHGTV